MEKKNSNVFKKIYDWIMLKAQGPNCKYILFVIAFIESVLSIFPLTVLFVGMALANTKNSFKYAFISTGGATLGAILGYSIGYYAWLQPNSEFTSLAHFFFTNMPGFTVETYRNIQHLFHEWDFLVIFTAAFTPMPFEIITICSGVFNIHIVLFIMSVIAGRGARYFLLGFLIMKYGEKIKRFIESYFNLIAFGVTACVIIIFTLIKISF